MMPDQRATIENFSIVESASKAILLLYTHGFLTASERNAARKRLGKATVKKSLTVEPVRYRYKMGGDGNAQGCYACGSPPIDWCDDPWGKLPWIVTLKDSGNWRFLIDRRDHVNPDMFSGFKINNYGNIGNASRTTGEGGRLALHRSHFIEDLPE